MKIELITTGSELILGYVLNTHIGYVSEKLMPLGLAISRNTTVPDGVIIREVVAEALERADIVIVTGGLGPTSDDITRDVLAELFSAPLEFTPEIWEAIHQRLCARNIPVMELMRSQAMVPRGAKWIPNEAGTAPGLHFHRGGKDIFCLPGPPNELHPMFDQQVLPAIAARVSKAEIPHLETYRIMGVGESRVQEMIETILRQKYTGIEIGYCARPGEVDLRLICKTPEHLAEAALLVAQTFGEDLYTSGQLGMEQVVVELARAAGKQLATAESCTGGLVAHRLTNVPGASAVLNRGWVTYSNEAKMDELRVRATTLEKHGAVSRETAHEMALGAIELSGADLAVSVTGIAGPSGGTPEKPVGLVYFGLAVRAGNSVKITTQERRLAPRRELFKQMASQVALDFLRRALLAK